ncbi:hypothetical protein [Fischerella sp. PCC 9605]|uniref:hypothetical protein n=1 Tax=Fischerella sp. PCC 9605 TaxID=1173024 RepID=UPI00047D03D5|nr:hypothetical protein [Fischerella sp. PCC 9605]
MKTILKNYCTTKQAQIFTALILTGILSISSGFTLLKSAIAAPRDILPETANEILKVNASSDGLPQPVARAILRDVSRTQGILPNKLEITEFSQKTWRNGCLDLPKPGEFCTQALVPGWQVMVSDGSQTWIYHTNSNGRSLRLANPNTPPNNQSDNLPTSVRDNVLATASKFTGLPTSQLRIVKVAQVTTDGCLGLPRPDEACIQIAQQAWEVTVQAGKQRLVYRANRDGSQVRLNEAASLISIPKPITNAVLRDASRWSGIPTSQLRILKAERHTWGNPCELTFNRICNKAYIPTAGWIITVDSGTQKWVYHVNEKASVVALDRTRILSKSAAKVIKQDALKRSNSRMPISAFRITEVQELADWKGACEGIANCTRPVALGWQATVSNGTQNWVYRVKEDGSEFEFQTVASLPKSIADTILADAAEELELPISQLRIVEVEKREWPDRCLGISEPLILCAPSIVSGWQVKVSNGQQDLVYRVGEPDTIKLDKQASKIAGKEADKESVKPVPIPSNELPPPLESGIVFRQISSGGFIGRTYETVLLDDGRLIRVRIGDANDSERSVRRVSLQQVRRFQKLLEEKGSSEFQNLNYPAPSGAADYTIYTLTSSDGTVQYNDISQNRLPENLRIVLKAWNQLLSSAQS